MLKLKVINNGDHAGLVWFPVDGRRINYCRGFGIQRSITRAGDPPRTSWLSNFLGLGPGAPKPAAGEEWRWPIQRFQWWDYGVLSGDQVSYQVTPVVGPNRDTLRLDDANASASSPPEVITSQDGRAIEAYFNRGIIASQWVARELDALATGNGTPHGKLMAAIADPQSPLREALGGLLLPKLLDLLAKASGKVYGALYELDDGTVIDALSALGKRCFLILGNGALKPPTNDENATVRAALLKAGQINLFDRMVGSPHFAHNKFFVFCDELGNAQSVWTGSTNCTNTGLCTQANNGILIKDPSVADAFLQAWQRLHQAGNHYPPALISANSTQRTFQVDNGAGGQGAVSVWFAPTEHGEDMEQARRLVNQARDGILFLFFNPGMFEDDPAQWTLLQTIINRHAPEPNPYLDSSLYIRGVVNQAIPGLTGPGKAAPTKEDIDPATPTRPVAIYDSGTPPARLQADVLVPNSIHQHFGSWENELRGASNVMIHSKVVVIDPFGDHPVLITGSHNLGMKASRSNDDNLVIVEGNAALAQAYALNIIGIFQEYRWRQYVAAQGPNPTDAAWSGPEDNDTWQDGHIKDDLREMNFWFGGGLE